MRIMQALALSDPALPYQENQPPDAPTQTVTVDLNFTLTPRQAANVNMGSWLQVFFSYVRDNLGQALYVSFNMLPNICLLQHPRRRSAHSILHCTCQPLIHANLWLCKLG